MQSSWSDGQCMLQSLGCLGFRVQNGRNSEGTNDRLSAVCSGIMYGEREGELNDDSNEQRVILSDRAEHIALLSSIPFSCAAIGMVVRCSGTPLSPSVMSTSQESQP